jgi:DNA-directed RNA polymerase subunit E'/Rpb7
MMHIRIEEMDSTMYNTIYIDDRIAVTPREINKIESVEDIRHLLEQKLKDKYENKCHSNGYIRPGSLHLLAKSSGIHEHGRFTGNILYDCRISCEVYYPIANSIVHVKIHKINKMGAIALLATDMEGDPMRINIQRDLHIGNMAYNGLEIGQIVSVKLLKSRFQTNDPFITTVGILANEDVRKEIVEEGKAPE